LGGSTNRSLYVALSDIVRGSAPVTIAFVTSGGVTVHGPLTIQPGQAGGTVTFDIADAAGAQTITAQLDATHQHASQFTSVQLQAPTAVSAGAGLLPGDVVSIGVTVSAAVTEVVPAVVTGNGLPTVNLSIPQGGTSATIQAVFAGIASFTLQAAALGATRSAQIAAAGMVSMNLADGGANLDGQFLPAGTTQAVVTLSGPCPRQINIALSTNPTNNIRVAPPQVAVGAGSTTSQPFQISVHGGLVDESTQVIALMQTQEISATVSVRGFGLNVPGGPIGPINPGGPGIPEDPNPLPRPPAANQ
jgi:hypothetical protein